jgi:hypothetical protein
MYMHTERERNERNIKTCLNSLNIDFGIKNERTIKQVVRGILVRGEE